MDSHLRNPEASMTAFQIGEIVTTTIGEATQYWLIQASSKPGERYVKAVEITNYGTGQEILDTNSGSLEKSQLTKTGKRLSVREMVNAEIRSLGGVSDRAARALKKKYEDLFK